MSDPIFPDGIRVYHPNEGAPEFIKGALVIDSLKFVTWLGKLPNKTVRLDIKQSRNGTLYLQLNTYQRKRTDGVEGCPQPETPYKPAANTNGFEDESIPF